MITLQGPGVVALQGPGMVALQEAESSLPYDAVGWALVVAGLVVTVAWVWYLFR